MKTFALTRDGKFKSLSIEMKQSVLGLGILVGSMVMHAGVQAAPITLTWSDTVAGGGTVDASTGISLGDPITVIITVDNGGSSVISQSWDETDFVSAKYNVGASWTATLTTLNSGWSTGSFSTDDAGIVLSAGTWGGWPTSDGYPFWDMKFPISNSTILYYTDGDAGSGEIQYLKAVGANTATTGSDWAATVPEPSTFALLALGMAGCVLVRRRSR